MSRTKFAATLIACITFGMMLAGATPAAAEDAATCAAPVVDRTADRVLDISAVTQTVETANSTGADVYVRAFETVPDGSLDAYWQESIADCANWRSGTADDGVPKGNIIMVAFSMDRQSAIFFGSGYNESIGNTNATAVRSEMGNYFRNGQFTEGVVSAVEELQALTDPNRPDKEASSTPAKPIDWAPFWWTVLVIVSVIAFVALLVWMYFLNRVRLRRIAARKELADAKQQVAAKVSSWEGEGEFLDVTFLTGGLQLPKKAQSRDYAQALQALAKKESEASIAFNRYARDELHDPQNKRLSLDEYVAATDDYESIVRTYGNIVDQLGTLKEDARQDALHYSFEGQAARAEVIRKTLEMMSGKLSDYGQLFATTVASRMHQRLSKELASVEELLQAKVEQPATHEHLTALGNELLELSEEFGRMQDAASSLSNPRGTLQRTLQNARARLQGMNIDTSAEERQLDRLDGDSLNGMLSKLRVSNSYERQLGVFEAFERRVGSIVGRAQARDDDYRAEQARKRRKEDERRRREERRRSSYSSSSSDSFYGAAAGAYVGSSLGSSHSSYGSSSSSDFGGGSSGSWGGGSDFGGGSSGSW